MAEDIMRLLVRACRVLDKNNITLPPALNAFWIKQKPLEDAEDARRAQAQTIANTKTVSSLTPTELELLRLYRLV